MPATNKPLRYRQIHLDFHTSEHIPGVGSAFDPEEFVATLQKAHIDSITIFAKCHHGWSYYPTKAGAPHPNLARPDLLGDMVHALNAADIECPIYISVMWDERNARLHPEWRVISATPNNHFAPTQLQAGWHTLCLNHPAYHEELLAQSREVASSYETPGLFFDIILTPDCVCPACIQTMAEEGLDPENPADRLRKDELVNERFRSRMSAALRAEFPGLRIFYNCGHIHKQGPKRFASYSHLELESLPTGGWGYSHFPSSARYAATLGFDFVAHTGKFHTSWGEFGGFKHPDALEFEAAQMVALGSKCLVGDQLHPDGTINPDTYASIGPAYARIEKLEPFLEGARQVTDVAFLTSEYFHPLGSRNNVSDDGAAQMLLELQIPFDVIDPSVAFETYKLIILPDEIPLDNQLAARFKAYLASGGRLLMSGTSAMNADGTFAVDAGVRRQGSPVAFNPSYIRASRELDPQLTLSPFVAYGVAETIVAEGAQVVAADIQDEKGRALETRFGKDKLRFVHCDVTDLKQLEAIMAEAPKAFGSLDVVWNNAGHGGTPTSVEELDFDGYDQTMNLLLKQVFAGTKFAIPHMKAKGGAIINTSSISAISAGYAPITYSVAKKGVAHFSKLAAAELAKYKIRVNSILPGFIATSIFGASLGLSREQADQMAEMLAQGGGRIQPAGRTGKGTDIAEMAAFLASDAASFITGQTIYIDGGRMIRASATKPEGGKGG